MTVRNLALAVLLLAMLAGTLALFARPGRRPRPDWRQPVVVPVGEPTRESQPHRRRRGSLGNTVQPIAHRRSVMYNDSR